MKRICEEDVFSGVGYRYKKRGDLFEEGEVTLGEEDARLCQFCKKNRSSLFYHGKAICIDCLCSLFGSGV